ncbi:MAG: hypothetical protein GWN07_30390, partial [Actinobacteria bacterium]|nr:hypothetical protein [Actinomycetota bacterium]NIS34951.1 hypothetical protein [Actinomycetota bacterium]NIU69691.1 hypothetical protein [Actinomycetota bacterium]NIW31562.1 hypothetical protein [Actinomycetota bacterium]NIX23895.1 hypothetical protein [Actinomycetota bacterium]
MRLTLGAPRGRLVRQVLAESVLLGLVGGLAGTLLAGLAIDLLPALGPAELPRLDSVGMNTVVLSFALV